MFAIEENHLSCSATTDLKEASLSLVTKIFFIFLKSVEFFFFFQLSLELLYLHLMTLGLMWSKPFAYV